MKIDLDDIKSYAAKSRPEILRDIARIVSVPSVEGKPEPDAPFGREPKKALDLALSIAEELGLSTRNFENKIGNNPC